MCVNFHSDVIVFLRCGSGAFIFSFSAWRCSSLLFFILCLTRSSRIQRTSVVVLVYVCVSLFLSIYTLNKSQKRLLLPVSFMGLGTDVNLRRRRLHVSTCHRLQSVNDVALLCNIPSRPPPPTSPYTLFSLACKKCVKCYFRLLYGSAYSHTHTHTRRPGKSNEIVIPAWMCAFAFATYR